MNTRICLYCGQEVREDQPYSFRKMGGVEQYWHYKCYLSTAKYPYELSESEREYLIRAVLDKEPNPDGLALLALRAVGYGK